MAESIYNKIGKQLGYDARLVRTAAHHPFSFLARVIEDPKDYRPIRLRYLGAFVPKPIWRKGMKKVKVIGLPVEGACIYARVPEEKYGRQYINLKRGRIEGGRFIADDNSVNCSIGEVVAWVSTIDCE